MMNESEFRKRFGDKLKMFRKQRNITQSELAEKFNYSDKAVSKWERGESVPDSFTVYKIADYFGVTVDDLFSDDFDVQTGELPVDNNENKKKSVQLFVPFISTVGVFFVASVFFFVMKNVPQWSDYAYYPFIYSIPVASIVLTVFASIWWNLLSRCICASVLIWSTAVAVYTTFAADNIKYIFVCCLILQAVCILAYLFSHFFRKKS